jgi:hypothetical protein
MEQNIRMGCNPYDNIQFEMGPFIYKHHTD